jgi:molecular chaperone Hsp33
MQKGGIKMSYILRGTVQNGDIRVFVAITTDLVEKARITHDLSPTASAALGRMLTIGSIMGTMLKSEKDSMTISINGRGEAGNIVVTTNQTGNIKGYISNPHVDPPTNEKGKLDVGGAVGKNGFVTVIKDMGLKEPYIGQVPISSGEIGEDLAYYFLVSEQVPTAISVGVLVDTDISILSAGGLIVQMMPHENELLADIITYRLEEIPPISKLIAEGKSGEDILNLLFDDMDLKIHERIEMDYVCDCNSDRIEKVLISLGREELEKLKEEEENIEIHCHFCNKKYNFTKQDIEKLLK